MKIFKKYGVILIIFLLVSFWLGFFITASVNKNQLYYSVTVDTDITASMVDVNFFKDALKKYKENPETHELEFVGYSYSSVKPDEFFKNNDIEILDLEAGNLGIRIKAKYFISSQGMIVSNDSFVRFNKVMNKVFKYHDQNYTLEAFAAKGTNEFLGAGIALALCFVFKGVFLIIVSRRKEEVIRDVKTLNPFKKEYWVLSLDKFRKMKVFDLCFIAILFALQLLCKFIRIPTGFANLGIGITYLVFSFICLLYGPFWGLVIGFFSDILGYFITPGETFFYLGYTVQAMLTGFVYGLCLFSKKPSFSSCLFARLIINIFINAIFGSFLWQQVSDLSNEGIRDYFLFLSLPKNILFLIPQALVMYLFLKLVTNALKHKINFLNE